MLEIYINIRESKDVHEASSPLHNSQETILWLTLNYSLLQTIREISNQNEERALLFIHEFKITDLNYISTILSTYPSKSSTNLQLIPQNPQQIYNSSLQILQQILDEIFSPHFHNPLLEISLDYFLQILKRWRKYSGSFWILLGWKLQISLHYKDHKYIWDIYEKYINF